MVCKFYNGIRLCDDVRYKIRGVEVAKWLISESDTSTRLRMADSDPGAARADWMIEHGAEGKFKIKHAQTGRYIGRSGTFYGTAGDISLKASADRTSCWLGIDITGYVPEVYQSGFKYIVRILTYHYLHGGESGGTAILNKENDVLIRTARQAKQHDGNDYLNTMWRFIPS